MPLGLIIALSMLIITVKFVDINVGLDDILVVTISCSLCYLFSFWHYYRKLTKKNSTTENKI